MTVLTQLVKAAGIAISATFPAYDKENGGVKQPRKSRVREIVTEQCTKRVDKRSWWHSLLKSPWRVCACSSLVVRCVVVSTCGGCHRCDGTPSCGVASF